MASRKKKKNTRSEYHPAHVFRSVNAAAGKRNSRDANRKSLPTSVRQMKPTFDWTRILPLLAVVAGSLIVLWPLLLKGFFLTDDGNWMVIRLSAFYQSLRDGQIPTRFLARLNYSYGYPVSNFLYPGFLYIGSLIRAVTAWPFVTIVKFLFGISVITGGLSVYLFLRSHVGKTASILGSFFFYLSPYLAYDMYKRGSVGEVLAIAVAAFCLVTIDRKWPVLLTFSLALLFLSHNSLAMLFIVLLGGYVVVTKSTRMFFSFVIALGLTTFFWFPAIYEQQYVRFSTVIVSNPLEYFITGGNAFLIGASLIIVLLLGIGYWHGMDKRGRFFIGATILSLLLTLPFTSVLWVDLPILGKLFQFPYRMLSVAVISGSLAFGFVSEHISHFNKRIVQILLLALAVITIFRIESQVERTNLPESFYTTNEATTTVADEYLPIWVTNPPTERVPVRVEVQKGNATFTPTLVSSKSIIGEVVAKEDSVIQLNMIYYPGWGVSVDGNPAAISYDNPRGVMRFPVLQGSHHILAEFRETIPRFVASVFSGIVMTGYLFSLTLKKLRGRSVV